MIFLPDEDMWFDESIVKGASTTVGSRKKRPRNNHALKALEHVDQGPGPLADICAGGGGIVEHQPDDDGDGG